MTRSYTRIMAGHCSKLLILRSVRVLARHKPRFCFVLRGITAHGFPSLALTEDLYESLKCKEYSSAAAHAILFVNGASRPAS